MRRTVAFVIGVFVLALTLPAFAEDVSVRGYYRSDGTYVQPHMRSQPDGNPYNNWSTKGNVNPYTGKEGTREPSTFGSGSGYGSGSSGYGYGSGTGSGRGYGSGSKRGY